MAYGVAVPVAVAAKDVDALNKTFIGEADIENGSVFTLGDIVSGQADEFAAVQPATANLAKQHYMAVSAILPVTSINGQYFYNMVQDPRAFINVTGEPIDGIALKVGDEVLLSSDALAGTKSTNTYVVATNGAYKLTWAAAAISGLSLKLVSTSYISIGDALGSQRVTAYRFIVEAVA